MVLIFDSHPVQYKAPVYQWVQKLKPDSFQVVYLSDCSLRGYRDEEFGTVVAWDTPLLSGYQNTVLNNERGVPLSGFSSLTGRGIYQLLKKDRPQAVILSQFIYEADLVTYLSCLWLGIPIWIRQETQDEAFSRSLTKKILRSLLYKVAYWPVKHAFFFGQLNREHLLRHGISTKQMSFSPFSTVSPASSMTNEIKESKRMALRNELEVSSQEKLVLFSGKLIGKKNPGMILQALLEMQPDQASRFKVVFVGSGELEDSLKEKAALLANKVFFVGFVNQSKITDYYLAADILVLPSRQAGETWGLVVNEALQAGCAVVMTNAVGCHREFEGWERVRVIRDGDVSGCAEAIMDLARFERSFDWCEAQMERYSPHAAAAAIAQKIGHVEPALP